MIWSLFPAKSHFLKQQMCSRAHAAAEREHQINFKLLQFLLKLISPHNYQVNSIPLPEGHILFYNINHPVMSFVSVITQRTLKKQDALKTADFLNCFVSESTNIQHFFLGAHEQCITL